MQTIAGRFDGQDWLAEPVDPTGWLAGPAVPGRDSVNGSNDDGAAGLPVGQQDATATPDVEGQRADGGRDGRARARSARRAGRVRHLRRVRTEGLRAEVVRVDPERSELVAKVSAVAARSAVEPRTEGYQMGRWARLALTMTALAAVVVVVVSMTAGSAPQALVDVTVTPGDTLWSIAGQAAPDRDPRDVIEEIRQLNDMTGDELPIGVVLRVPTDAE